MLKHFKEIIAESCHHPLDNAFFHGAEEHLTAVCKVYAITFMQAALFALLLEESGEGSVSINKIAEKLKCGKIRFLEYLDDFETLEKKHLIRSDQYVIISDLRVSLLLL
jgi:hypothetical protein